MTVTGNALWSGSAARSSFATFAVRIFGLAAAFLFAVGAARMLGPSGYGVFAFALSIATVVATFATLGANGLAVREIAALSSLGAWDGLRKFVKWSVTTVLVASLVGAAGMAAAAQVAGPYRTAMLIGAVAVPFLAWLHLWRGITQGTGRVVLAQIPGELVRWFVALILIAILAVSGARANPSTLMMLMVAALVAAGGWGAVSLRAYMRTHRERASVDFPTPSWLPNSVPFLAVAVFGIVGTEISTLLLGSLSGPREAGLYQPIARLASLMMLANEAIEAVLAPRIVRLWQARDTPSLQNMLRRAALASTLATALICAAILIASPIILRAFGTEFTEYRPLLLWIALAQVANAATGAAPLLLAMAGEMRLRLRAQLITLVAQAGLGLALVPLFGATGAAISLVVAILVWSISHWWLAFRATAVNTSVVKVGWTVRGASK